MTESEKKRLFLRVGDEVCHDGHQQWGIGVVVEIMTSTVPGGTCLARVRFQDGHLRVFNNDMDSEECCYYFGVRRFWNPSHGVNVLRSKFFSLKFLIAVLMASHLYGVPVSARAVSPYEFTEEAGVAIGVTAGNMWFVPIKAISVLWGLAEGALSLVLTGNPEVTEQIWRGTQEAPYFITPEVARKALGERPELTISGSP